MGRFVPIAIIYIEHNYYNPPVNRLVDLVPTSETQTLMERRGVMFRKTDRNEWQWIKLDEAPGFMEDDVLEVSMIVKDPQFLQLIAGSGYDLGSFYKFKLEYRDVEVNDDYVWEKETDGQKQKDEFCRIVMEPAKVASERLRMVWGKMDRLDMAEDWKETREQLETIKQEIRQLQVICCRKFTLRFCSSACYWEYLFVFNDENDLRGKDLSLKAPKDIVVFGLPEKYKKTNLGTNVWRIVSTERVRLKERYNFSLWLYIGKQIESRFVLLPQIGKYQSETPYTIRAIYYIK